MFLRLRLGFLSIDKNHSEISGMATRLCEIIRLNVNDHLTGKMMRTRQNLLAHIYVQSSRHYSSESREA
jgi:hypothetical protein